MPSKHRPYTARLSGNRLLSLPGATKEVRQIVVETGPDLTYEAGDALGVWPANRPDLVTEWLKVTGLRSGTPVPTGTGPMALGEALLGHYDITRITPALLRFVADRTQDRLLKKLLRSDNKTELAQWTWGRQAIDVIAEFPVTASATEWAEVLSRLQPRLYSISSSPLTSPYEISLTTSVVRFENPSGVQRHGVCSTYLADTPPDTPVRVFVQKSPRFRPPANPATPMIMIGPGTGVAPFLGFLQQRRALGHHAPNWLFFGEQHRATDFYYRRELQELQDDGTLTHLDLAFSRDQRSKIYVQDRIREHAAQFWSWLQSGAHLYVCGDATRMAKDVDQTLQDVIAHHGHMPKPQATKYLTHLTTQNRYTRDVY